MVAMPEAEKRCQNFLFWKDLSLVAGQVFFPPEASLFERMHSIHSEFQTWLLYTNLGINTHAFYCADIGAACIVLGRDQQLAPLADPRSFGDLVVGVDEHPDPPGVVVHGDEGVSWDDLHVGVRLVLLDLLLRLLRRLAHQLRP